ncbi:MAG TPA: type I phosphomannose isomerase catalytic subunit [Gelidibacter sp.]|uniref:type I phosphomannose isomerase catalytic subunit n=1 Tax=Gelidibacter sp. TaxID=2018083 RepID=UPI002C2F9D2E|nr:type I phosphomannose isomerase catalytic subunit [Gelidibacter sp.]HXJ99141.1 type I phosphomannose isomerase catalytic subunit [Gelidibacter sp.]
MSIQMYPLKFEPIYQYRIWGGRKFEHLLSKPLPENEPIGEAWLLSDRKDFSNTVTDGILKNTTLTNLMKDYRYEIMGKLGYHFEKFPLLLKLLDCNEVLSVQVHPSDHQKEYIPHGESGKTEAWIVLETDVNSRIYAGLKKGTTKESLIQSIQDKSVAEQLHSFAPNKGDAVFIQSGTVHTLGGTVVFEVQENSDVTFRLYDWDRIDSKTGKPRDLQVDQALACIDFNQVEIGPVVPVESTDIENAEILFDNNHFKLWRIQSQSEFKVGIQDEPTVLVCTEGSGIITYQDVNYTITKGEVVLLPAIIGVLNFQPENKVTLLQISVPDKK